MKRGGRLKRTELKRSTKRLQRKKRMRQRNPERAARRERENFGDVARLVRELPCCCCRRAPPSQAAHYVTRGSGEGKARHLVPLCWKCHREQEGATTRFEARHTAHDIDGALVHGFLVGEQLCATLAEVASYVVEAARDHVCLDWRRRGRCAVCRDAIDGPEACTP